MRIAVDARALAHPTAGIGRYTDSLINELIPQGGRWFLYSDKPLLKNYANLGDVIVRLPERKRIPGVLRGQMDFVRWAREDAVDVFWSPRHHLPIFLPRAIKKLVTIHDVDWVRHPASMKKLGWLLEFLLMPVSLLLADQIISVSNFTAAEINKVFRISPGKIRTIHLAAYVAREDHLDDDSDKPPDIAGKDYFLFVGTPEPRKNLRRLLIAFKALLAEEDGNPHLCVVGGHGWGGSTTDELIHELDLQASVSLLGHISDSDLDRTYKKAMALVVPSLYEGFGIPIVEAMRHGLPIITGNCSSMPEVAGDAALLVNPLCVDEIKTAMSRLYSDQELRAELSERALKRAENFSWKQTADQTLMQIKRLAGVA